MTYMLRCPQGDGYSFATGGAGDGFGGNGSGGGTGHGGVGVGGDGFSVMEPSLKNRFYCSGLP
jgi:hypothetical protein